MVSALRKSAAFHRSHRLTDGMCNPDTHWRRKKKTGCCVIKLSGTCWLFFCLSTLVWIYIFILAALATLFCKCTGVRINKRVTGGCREYRTIKNEMPFSRADTELWVKLHRIPVNILYAVYLFQCESISPSFHVSITQRLYQYRRCVRTYSSRAHLCFSAACWERVKS